MPHCVRGALCVCAVLSFAVSTIGAQPTVSPATYARAGALEPTRLLSSLRNGAPVPHWIGARDQFWYQRDVPGGHEFLMVDAATGRRQPAFDHEAVRRALTAAGGRAESALLLSVTALRVGASGAPTEVTLRSVGVVYVCALRAATVTCTRRPLARSVPSGVLASPDGMVGAEVRAGNLWLRGLPAGDAVALTFDGEGPNFGYGIYPGGDFGVVARNRALEAGQPLPPNGAFWSPDSRWLIVPRDDQRHVADYPLLESAPIDGSFRPKVHLVRVPLTGERPAIRTWHIVNARTRSVQQCDALEGTVLGWSADTSTAYVLESRELQQVAVLREVELSTCRSRVMVEERIQPRMDLNTTPYNPPNVRVENDGRDVLWWSQRDGWGHLYLYDGTSGRLRNQVTRRNWLVRDIIRVDAARRQVWFTGVGREPGNPYYRYLYRVNFDGSGLILVTPAAGDHAIAPSAPAIVVQGGHPDVVSPSGKYVVDTWSTPGSTPQTVIRNTTDGRVIAPLETADASALTAAGYRPPEEFTVMAADGSTALWGVLYKPVNFDSTMSYPIIDIEYTSPLIGRTPRDYQSAIVGVSRPSGAMLAALGFVVVAIDARGTPFRSRDFALTGHGRLDLMGLDDHVAAIRTLGRRHAFIDTTRVGIYGHSFGGWGAIRAMLEFPDFFKVGVASAPPGGFHNMYPGWDVMQGAPQYSDGTAIRPTGSEVAPNWKAIDARQQVNRLKGRLLILLSELDENVLPGSTLQFVDALSAAGKDVDLLYLTGRNHNTGRSPGSVRRIEDYFVQYLLGVAPPAWNALDIPTRP